MGRTARFTLMVLATGMLSCRDAGVTEPPASALTEGAQSVGAQPEEEVGDLDSIARYLSPRGTTGVERATAMIGAAGGSVRLHDFEVIVPPGAVDRDTRFEITILPDPARHAHAWASFKPHNQAFAVPVLLRVPLAGTESAGGEDVHVLWRNGSKWDELPSTITPDGRLETRTDHFSIYGTQRVRGITMIGG